MSRTARAFGSRLRKLRIARGLSQEQVAERAGLSTNAVGSFERGVRFPRLKSLDALLDALNEEPEPLADSVLMARDGVGSYLGDLPDSGPMRRLVDLLEGEPDEVVSLVEQIARVIIEAESRSHRAR